METMVIEKTNTNNQIAASSLYLSNAKMNFQSPSVENIESSPATE